MTSFLSKWRGQALFAVASLALASCAFEASSQSAPQSGESTMVVIDNLPADQATAVFAMGCFWCGEADFEKIDGVVDVISGYTGGQVEDPTYEQVTRDNTGHYEAILVTYDTTKLSYDDLLAVFWKNVDPYDARGQFCDKGTSYRAAVFPGSEEERASAENSKMTLEAQQGAQFVTTILDRATFYRAEEYHQDYYKKNPVRYNYYRAACGRDRRLDEVWSSED